MISRIGVGSFKKNIMFLIFIENNKLILIMLMASEINISIYYLDHIYGIIKYEIVGTYLYLLCLSITVSVASP